MQQALELALLELQHPRLRGLRCGHLAVEGLVPETLWKGGARCVSRHYLDTNKDFATATLCT